MAKFLLFLMLTPALGQSISTRTGARSASLGGTGLILRDDASLFNNVGALAWLNTPTTFFTCEVTPTLPGANRVATSINLPISIGVLSVGAFRFGDKVYSEQMLSSGLGHRIGSTSLGVKANLLQYHADGYETRTAITIDVGGLTKLTDSWSVAASLCNLTQATLGSETLPVILSVATGFQTERFLVTVELEKRLDSQVQLKGGVELTLVKRVFVRTGFGLQPINLSFGLGARSKRLTLDFSTAYRRSLEFSYQASASYRLSKGKRE